MPVRLLANKVAPLMTKRGEAPSTVLVKEGYGRPANAPLELGNSGDEANSAVEFVMWCDWLGD